MEGLNFYFNLNIFETTVLLPNVIKMMLIELAGIRMAATKGDKTPCTAKYNPITL
jgi:hypothetical protein